MLEKIKSWAESHPKTLIAVIGGVFVLVYYVLSRRSGSSQAVTMTPGGDNSANYLPPVSAGGGGGSESDSTAEDNAQLQEVKDQIITITDGFKMGFAQINEKMLQQEQKFKSMPVMQPGVPLPSITQPPAYFRTAPGVSNDYNVFDTFENKTGMSKAVKSGVLESMVDIGTQAQEIYNQTHDWSDPRITQLHEKNMENASKAGLSFDSATGTYH